MRGKPPIQPWPQVQAGAGSKGLGSMRSRSIWFMVRLHRGADRLEIFATRCYVLNTPTENNIAAGSRQSGPAVLV
jgi:hypothetical protein